MRVIDIDNIVGNMRDQTAFVLRCEEVFHDKVSSACATILNSKKRTILLSGPSGSGKTTTANRIRTYLENLGIPVIMLSMDNFFIPVDERPAEAEDWESPLCVNFKKLTDCIHELKNGKVVNIPIYDFKTGTAAESFPLQGNRDAFVIIEGIHALNPLMYDGVRDEAIGVYVTPRTRIVTRDDKIVTPERIRVARRMIRDFNTRGHSLRDTVMRAESVDRGEVNYIKPFKTNAPIHIDTFHDYELCIISRYLRELPEFNSQLDQEFIDEYGLTELMKVVREIPPLMTPYVPKDSLIREFIGNSIYYES